MEENFEKQNKGNISNSEHRFWNDLIDDWHSSVDML